MSEQYEEMAQQWAVQKIERLEAELAKEKAEHKDLLRMIEKDQYDLIEKVWRMEAELADWQRHGVKVTEDCKTCEGSGFRQLEYRPKLEKPCPDCGGTGKKLRDGVYDLGRGKLGREYVIPAE